MEDTLTIAPMSQVQGLSAEEFDGIVREHQAKIYRVLWCEVRDEDAAATLTQECLLKAYRARHEFRGEANVQTWLIRIAINLARDYQRNRRQSFWRRLLGVREEEAALAAEYASDNRPGAERSLIAREELAQTMLAVKRLSPQQQTAFRLRYVEELTIEEIAAAMELEEGTVKSHLSRAVAAIRQQRKTK